MKKIAFTASQTPEAQEALKTLQEKYDHVDVHEAEVLVILGGDGFMLETLHTYKDKNLCFYGINFGSVGFLLNSFHEKEDLQDLLLKAEGHLLHPLKMVATTTKGEKVEALSINEVSLLRKTRQAAHIRIDVDGKTKLDTMVADGVLVSTPAGSTAYNFSVHGPILPLSANLVALTPISPFRPRRWRGAVLPHTSVVEFHVLEHSKRPVNAVADFTEIADVKHVKITEAQEMSWRLLFDPEHNLEERILNEQFIP